MGDGLPKRRQSAEFVHEAEVSPPRVRLQPKSGRKLAP